MAAIAYPVQSVAPRRDGSARARRERVRSGHLRLVSEPLFDEPIFEEFDFESGLGAEQLSDSLVWQHRPPVIASRHIVTTFDWIDSETYRPSLTRHPAAHRVVARETGSRSTVGPSALRDDHVAPRVIVAPRPGAHGLRTTTPARYRLRRFVGCLALGFALVGGLSAASAIAGVHQGTPVAISGAVPVAGGYRYIVQPGDTLWSIASRVFPSGDPRALVANLAVQIKSTTAVPGDRLLLP